MSLMDHVAITTLLVCVSEPVPSPLPASIAFHVLTYARFLLITQSWGPNELHKGISDTTGMERGRLNE